MADTCACGRAIEQPKTGRRRSKCTACSPPERRDRRVRNLGPVVVPIGSSRVTPQTPPLVEAAHAELAAMGRESTTEGVIVLTLAAQIAAGGGSAAGLAALVREFHASKARAMDGTTSTADVIDGIFGTGTS